MIVTATYNIELSDADIKRIAMEVVKETKKDKDKDKLLNKKEAAEHCGVSPQTFWRWRERCQELQEIAITAGRVVKYRAEDLDKFLEGK